MKVVRFMDKPWRPKSETRVFHRSCAVEVFEALKVEVIETRRSVKSCSNLAICAWLTQEAVEACYGVTGRAVFQGEGGFTWGSFQVM